MLPIHKALSSSSDTMTRPNISDPRYDVEERVYLIPPSDPLHTLTGTVDRQPTLEEPYYTVISDAPAGKEWSVVASSVVPHEEVTD